MLLGRELSDMVALRHAGLAIPGLLDADRCWAASSLLLLTVPLLNLLAPVLGAAMATHLVHRARKTS